MYKTTPEALLNETSSPHERHGCHVGEVVASCAKLARHTRHTPYIDVQETATIPSKLLQQIRAMLDEAFDCNFDDHDWEHALGGWHTIVMDRGEVLAHAAVVPRLMDIGGWTLRSGYVEAVATAPRMQRSGYGSCVMAVLAQVIRQEYDIGLLSTSLHGFYGTLGWERWRGSTFVLRNGRRMRTRDEDVGIMALRFGPSAVVSLSAPITCRPRQGDDW